MKLPRRRFLVALILAVATWAFFHFSAYYHVRGWLRGDAYFAGMPTCYWADELNGDYNTPEWLKKVKEWLGMKSTSEREVSPILTGKRDAAPVLMQFAADTSNSPSARVQVIGHLSSHHGKSHAAELSKLFFEIFITEPESTADFRRHSAWALARLADQELPLSIDAPSLLKHEDREVALLGACLCWMQGKDIETSGAMIVEQLENNRGKWKIAFASHFFSTLVHPDALPYLVATTYNSQDSIKRHATFGIASAVWRAVAMGREIDAAKEPYRATVGRLRELSASPDRHIQFSAQHALELIAKQQKKG